MGKIIQLHDPSVATLTFTLVVNRTLFGICVAYFILMMLNEHTWALRSVLSWPVWIPFARLSYSAYLLQFTGDDWSGYLIAPPAGDTSEDRSVWFAAAATLSFTLLSCAISFGLAFVVYMAIEKPVMNLRLA